MKIYATDCIFSYKSMINSLLHDLLQKLLKYSIKMG